MDVYWIARVARMKPRCIFKLVFIFIIVCVILHCTLFSQDIKIERLESPVQHGLPCNLSPVMKKQAFDLRIIVLTYSRPESLDRLLQSLNDAIYGQDSVVLDVWVDRNERNEICEEILHTTLNFMFRWGICNIHIHPVHVGIKGQWLSTWKPVEGSKEIAVILEDDVIVSKYYYAYLKLVYSMYSHRTDIAGFSLQGRTIKHDVTAGEKWLKVNKSQKVFLYPTLGTSGYSPKLSHWLKFTSWNNENKQKNITVPLVPNHIASFWYLSLKRRGRGHTMWEMEYLYYTQVEKLLILYPNLEEDRGLVANALEDGLHYKNQRQGAINQLRRTVLNEWDDIFFSHLPHFPIVVGNDGGVVDQDKTM